MQRKLIVILSADIVGFSGLMEAAEAETFERVKANRSEIFDPLLAEHGGRLVKLIGDGALVEFTSVVGAVECGLAIQQRTAESESSREPAKRIRYRIGINLGEVIVDGDDIYGDGVNIAARLQALAPVGGVAVSQVVRDHLLNKLDCGFLDRGEHALKNIAQPVHVYFVVPSGGDVPLPARARWPTKAPQIQWRYAAAAILALLATAGAFGYRWLDHPVPVSNMAAASASAVDQTERVEVADLAVRQKDPVLLGLAPEIGAALIRTLTRSGIDAAPATGDNKRSSPSVLAMRVTGVLARDGEDIVAETQVLDLKSGLVLATPQLREKAQAVVAYPDLVGIDLAGVLDCAIEDRRQSRRVIDAPVFALYLNTCDALVGEGNTERGLETARRLVKAAPDLAIAWAMLGIIQVHAAQDGDRSASESASLLLEGRQSAQHALALDPQTPKAYIAIAMSYPDFSHWLERFRAVEKAQELDPNLGPARITYVRLLRAAGRVREMIQVARQMRDSADPRVTGMAGGSLIAALAQSGDLEGAKEIVRDLKRREPDVASYALWEIASFWEPPTSALKDIATVDTSQIDPKAVACVKTFLRELPGRISAHAHGLPAECATSPAYRKILELVREGDIDGAYAAFMSAGDINFYNLRYFYGAAMQKLWSDPRFMTATARFGLTEYWIKSNRWPDFCSNAGLPYDCRKAALAALTKPIAQRK